MHSSDYYGPYHLSCKSCVCTYLSQSPGYLPAYDHLRASLFSLSSFSSLYRNQSMQGQHTSQSPSKWSCQHNTIYFFTIGHSVFVMFTFLHFLNRRFPQTDPVPPTLYFSKDKFPVVMTTVIMTVKSPLANLTKIPDNNGALISRLLCKFFCKFHPGGSELGRV